MDNKINIVKKDGSIENVLLVTYLISDDMSRKYLVYSKGEEHGDKKDKVIYISRMEKKNEQIFIEEISEEKEWQDVQHLLKKIANAI